MPQIINLMSVTVTDLKMMENLHEVSVVYGKDNVVVTVLISSSDKTNIFHAHTQARIDPPSKARSSIPLDSSVLMAALLHAAVSYSSPVKYRPFGGRDIN